MKRLKVCGTPGCDNLQHSRGVCHPCWNRGLNTLYGQPDPPARPAPPRWGLVWLGGSEAREAHRRDMQALFDHNMMQAARCKAEWGDGDEEYQRQVALWNHEQAAA